MWPVSNVFTAHTGLNMLRRDMIQRSWMSSISVCKNGDCEMQRSRKSATGAGMLHVHKWETCVRIMLGIIKNSVVQLPESRAVATRLFRYPKTQIEILCFLGLWNVIQQFFLTLGVCPHLWNKGYACYGANFGLFHDLQFDWIEANHLWFWS